MQDFVQRHQEVAFDILAALCKIFAFRARIPRPAKPAGGTTATAEELLEEIAETRAVEMEFGTFIRAAAESVRPLSRLPFGMVPIRAELVILPPLVRIAENFVGFVDFLELVFRPRLIFGDIGVILARQGPESILDFRFARIRSYAENVVVVLECKRHGYTTCLSQVLRK